MQITPNKRLAIFLQKENKKNQNKIKALPFKEWIEHLYTQLIPISKVSQLTTYEEELIWEKIISNSNSGQQLLRIRPVACLCQEANELIRQWKITSVPIFSESEECLQFSEWWSSYNAEIETKGWLDNAMLLDWVTENLSCLASTTNVLPASIEFIGFSEWTPQQTLFIETLKSLGIKISMKDLSFEPKSIIRSSFLTSEEELFQAVSMSKHWLQENPHAQIGLVVLDLEQRREEIECMLRSFLPEGSFNIAAPIPLSKHPIIAAALLGLSLTAWQIPLESISRFLRSPFYIGGIEEQSVRAALDVTLHHLKQSHYKLEEIVAVLKATLFDEAQKLSHCLETIIALRSSISGRANTTQWIEIIKQILGCLSWGLGRPLNQNETLIQAEWESLLTTYQKLEKILGDHSFAEALYHIEILAQKTAFTPPTKNANVHALGLLEAVGIPFDYLWCLGFSEKLWPKAPSPNPFIPIQLQCELNLPRSHAARELQKAKYFTNALCHGAKNTVIFSHPSTIEDRHLRVSPLLKQLPCQEISFNCQQENDVTKIANYSQPSLQPFEEISIPPLKELKGSLRALTLQALCPFKAFAVIRLKATKLQPPPRSLTKSERGEMVHEILQLFWQDINAHAKLISLSDTKLQEQLKNNIQWVLSRWKKRFPRRLKPQYMVLEHQRLLNLLLRFIAVEKLRQPFTISALELKTQCDIGPLTFSLRIDRIDRLENGNELLIDYKTGQTKINHWLGDPPQEPQLPLYCISRSSRPVGIAYGILRSNDLKYQGIAKEELSIPGIKASNSESWEDLCKRWHIGLEKLSTEFAQGIATIKPIEGNTTCRNCDLQTLCRINDIADPQCSTS